ncbi:glutamine amidotransferase-like class 1 domain-containing protein 3, mitochondrial isoform X2 [Hypanus sabinus]|uniref:glutamine amidotransferase-like class 1 domain-containing protein 3, mitochondrial isoform X2 n=1 Tax=Hypanus sabinus TaxID=79690 RepID=UPI0028C3F411|nr:glutamine amidotransferase-like class 1 domain-containing protein 3, mitochondrial isoform X2 [Hypanus sabinus]
MLLRTLALQLRLCRFHSTARGSSGARVAVVLSGCGVFDGSEIHEASAILVHLSRGGADFQVYAPNVSQMHVIDHVKGEAAAESRNVLVESARIARGQVLDLVRLRAEDHDAVIFPGGFGAAKNLSTFATDGKDCQVIPDVHRVLTEFHKAQKPIGHPATRLLQLWSDYFPVTLIDDLLTLLYKPKVVQLLLQVPNTVFKELQPDALYTDAPWETLGLPGLNIQHEEHTTAIYYTRLCFPNNTQAVGGTQQARQHLRFQVETLHRNSQLMLGCL